MKEVKVIWWGIDDNNRPIFRDISTYEERYFGSTRKLFRDSKEAKEFYKNKRELNDLVYFGKDFNCEPLGNTQEELGIKIVQMQEVEKDVFKYDTKKKIYLLNGKEVEKDYWLNAKSFWEYARSCNNLKSYIEKWGFVNHDWFEEGDVLVLIFYRLK